MVEEEVEGEKTLNDSAGLDQQSGIRSAMDFGKHREMGGVIASLCIWESNHP